MNPLEEQKQRVYTTHQIFGFSALFGPFVGIYMTARNFWTFGDDTRARKTITVGFLLATAYLVGIVFIPDQTARTLRYALPWFLPGALFGYVSSVQAEQIKSYRAAGWPAKGSMRKVFGWGLLSLMATVAIIAGVVVTIHPGEAPSNQDKTAAVTHNPSTVSYDLQPIANPTHGYTIKLPKGFGLAESNSQIDRYVDKSASAGVFSVDVTWLPANSALAYANNTKDDGELQIYIRPQLTDEDSWLNVISVWGQVNAVGTNWKHALFTTGEAVDEKNQSLYFSRVVILKNDGSCLVVTAATLKQSQPQLDPVFDSIFKSVSLQ